MAKSKAEETAPETGGRQDQETIKLSNIHSTNDNLHDDETTGQENSNEEDIALEGEESEDEDARASNEFSNKRIVLQRFTVYNSLKTMYIVGSNAKESLFRVLEVGRDPNDEDSLMIIEDKNYFYTRKDMVELISELNKSVDGGIHKISHGYGLLGFIKFTIGYYLSIITKCSQVAVLGGHFIYHIDETKLIPLDINYRKPDKYSDEERLLSIFKYLDLSKTFYFSYTYDITNTLQTNFLRHKELATDYQFKQHTVRKPQDIAKPFERNKRFVWNNLLFNPILQNTEVAAFEWFQPIIHGFIDQANISIYGKKIYITLIARRSHHYAGPRFLKRGVNDKGNVANEVETEQIVSDMLVTSFHDPRYGFYNNPRYTSFVQHRGSIPLYWNQDLNRLPKPPIEINLSDPFYQSSALHFNNLFQRYGSPIIILNLIKTKEKQPRESKLNRNFIDCVDFLNQFLPNEHKLQFKGFDMSKNSKKNMDVIGPLKSIASSAISQIGFFHNGTDLKSTRIQKGIIRTNCIDCLDRTNAAQFITCKEALSHQLESLGLITKKTPLDYDSDLINILTEIFHDHGDTIAVQYGGSNLVNTMDSYRRINQWSSHTRDILNSIKRIYSNSFMDLIRQEAINLFLGNYNYNPSKPKLWELQNDYNLHNSHVIKDIRFKRSYIHWFNSAYLADSRANLIAFADKAITDESQQEKLEPYPDYNDNWYNEFYVPRKFQSLSELFQFNMNSNSRYFPSNMAVSKDKQFDYSPFQSRNPMLLKDDYRHRRTSKDGLSNVKYLETNCMLEDCVDGELDEVSQKKHSVDKLSSVEKSKGNQYEIGLKTLPNSKQIKSFLADKIEKLGYNSRVPLQPPSGSSGNPNSTEKLSFSPNSDSTFSFSDSSVLSPLTPLVQEQDRSLYHNIINLPAIADNELDPCPQEEDFIVNGDDINIYKSYFNRPVLELNSKSDDMIDSDAVSISSRNVNSTDLHLYSNYLGMDDKLALNTEDNYIQ